MLPEARFKYDTLLLCRVCKQFLTFIFTELFYVFLGHFERPSKYMIVALMTALSVIILALLAVTTFLWIKRRKARDPLGFVTINMNNADEDDYNISWIDPVTGDPIRLNGVDVEMPLSNGTLTEVEHDGYDDEDDLGDSHEQESRDTDRML